MPPTEAEGEAEGQERIVIAGAQTESRGRSTAHAGTRILPRREMGTREILVGARERSAALTGAEIGGEKGSAVSRQVVRVAPKPWAP